MLVTRQLETEQNPWSISKLETIFSKSSSISRMSNNYEPPLSTQSDWQGQYSFLPPGENSIFSQSYDNVTTSPEHLDSQPQAQAHSRPGNPLDIENMKSETSTAGGNNSNSSPLRDRRSLDPLGLRQQRVPSPIPEQPEPQDEQYSQKPSESVPEESLASIEASGMSIGSNLLSSISSAGPGSEIHVRHQDDDGQITVKEDDDEILDEEDMLEGEGEGDAPSQPQTAAERTAQRRKMKRFRLTHQQTRFLMSEFSKQPHPDAAHRERLSREIPGLSPRQVQVWFQNRRAKIKRLTADDRDRMIKMRAVPDDFDNIQALHSPYGAVHGLHGGTLSSPVDFGGSYGDHMMRPLMVDVRRHGGGGDEHMSPTGLSPAFGGIGFNPSGSLNNPDIISPLSAGSGDRYGYPSHLSTPLSAGPRTSNPYARPTIDTSMSMHNHHARQQIRPLQPLQLRETLTRSRSDSLQSPLRTSMSWKGDAIDYTTYQGSQSPQMSGRQAPGYPQDQMSGTSSGGLGTYDSSYSSNTVQSPTHMSYPAYPSSTMQSNSQNRSRIRATSNSGLPLNLDLRNQFRSISSGHNMQPTAHSPGPRTGPSSSQMGAASSSYTAAGYPSAPLTAPIDYLPRTPGFRSSAATDYSIPQMSAPIAASNDFAQAFQNMAGSSSRTPMRDSFGGGGERGDDYSQDSSLGLKRKRSFTGPSSATTTGQNTYGTTA